jgi:acetyl esterase
MTAPTILLAALCAAFFVMPAFADAPVTGQPEPGFAEKMRTAYRQRTPSAGRPDPVAHIRELRISATDPARTIPARLYVPATAADGKNLPVIVFLHGGGFVAGDLDTHDVLARALANGARALLIAVDYRLAPEHPFPAALEDAYAALQWAGSHASDIGGDARRIAIAGDSAGGNLATAAALLARDRRGPALAAQVSMYANLGNGFDTPSWRELGEKSYPTRKVMSDVMAAYVPAGVQGTDPLVAPLRAGLRGLPATLVQVGEADPLRDENRAYADKLRAAGVDARIVVYRDARHGFIQYYKDEKENPQGRKALQDATAFLRGVFDRRQGSRPDNGPER